MFKKLQLLLVVMLISLTEMMAQAPNQINYQAVATNANGTAMANQNIRVRLKIRTGSANGTVVYSEARNVTTDATGLFNITMGSAGGTVIGSWSAIDWNNGTKYLQTEIDPAGGSSFTNMGTQQLVSVPYAQQAKSAEGLTPNAVIPPSQIATTGASTNQVLQFNGTAWVPATLPAGGGGSLNLPFSETDSSLTPMFYVNNKHVDAAAHAIMGESYGAIGVFGNSETKQGVYGSANSATYAGVFGYNYNANGAGVHGRTSQSGTGVWGEAINSGTGIKGTATAGTAINGTSNNGTGVSANSTNGVGLIASSTNNSAIKADGTNAQPTIDASNINGLGYAIRGTSPMYHAVFGTTSGTGKAGLKGAATGTGGYGVYGESNHNVGIGVYGSNSAAGGTGVYGYVNNGTAVKAVANTGTALDVNGNVKIAGGNTTPSAGAVLTSDANGNATWKNNRVAFRAVGIAGLQPSLPKYTPTKVHFATEAYDLANNYALLVGSIWPTASQFTVPKSGVYHIDAQVVTGYLPSEDYVYANIYVRSLRFNNVVTLAESHHYCQNGEYAVTTKISTDLQLIAGESIWIEVEQDNGSGSSSSVNGNDSFFDAHLIFEN